MFVMNIGAACFANLYLFHLFLILSAVFLDIICKIRQRK